jgi:hypothetical protein
VLDIIGQGGRDFHNDVSTLLNLDKRIHKNSTGDGKGLRDDIYDFFKDKRYASGKSCDDVMHRLRKVLLGLETSFEVEPKTYQVLASEDNVHGLKRQEEVIRHLKTLEAGSHFIECRRRLCLLRLNYEIDRLLPHVAIEKNEKSNIAAAERKFAELSGESPATIRAFRKISHKYTIIANRKHGLGFLLLLGSHTKWM